MSENSCLHFSERFPHGSMAMCRARDSRQLSYYSLESGGVWHPQLTGLKVSPSHTGTSQLCSDFPCGCMHVGVVTVWKCQLERGIVDSCRCWSHCVDYQSLHHNWHLSTERARLEGTTRGHLSLQAGFPRAHCSELCPQTAFGYLQRKLPSLSGFGT